RIRPSFTKKMEKILDVDDINGHNDNMVENPLAKPYPWWHDLYQRIKLFPWWIKYNIGLTEESELKDKIILIATEMKLEKRWVKKMIRHAISEFSKKGLGLDYYGYHNIDHELEATYFTLLSIKGHISKNKTDSFFFSPQDIKYLFVAALFHDYDPSKKFDKPNEESVEWFLRNDPKIKKFVDLADIDIDVVIAIIYRTAYPFKGEIAECATKRIRDLLTKKQLDGYQNDEDGLVHYQQLGWFLSVCERIAGYTLGNTEHANKLARSNAHALGWHPSIMNEESVKYFDSLKEENEMLQFVLDGISPDLKNNFFNNVSYFKNLHEHEKKIRSLAMKKQIRFICKSERIRKNHGRNDISDDDLRLKECVLDIYHKLPIPLKGDERQFLSSLSDPNTILVTLRIKRESLQNSDKGNIGDTKNMREFIDIEKTDNGTSCIDELVVGYVKGGPIEKYGFRRGTVDENYGKNNTIYMEWICIKPGYWGSSGGHLLRMNFLLEAKKRGYNFVTGYVHRNVIMKRIKKGESIQIVQKYDPDKLDYYRIDLSAVSINAMTEEEDSDEFATVVYP
ncbi:MAG: hypothetical protein ACTHLL_03355, partial [Candidatus Nitrosocosmicus sp.]